LIASAIGFAKVVTSGGVKIAMRFRNIATEQARHINGKLPVALSVDTRRKMSRYIWVSVLNIALSPNLVLAVMACGVD
jgi:hypothetical protein